MIFDPTPRDDQYTRAALHVAVLSADVSQFCDHAEHCEVVDPGWVLGAAEELRRIALSLARHEHLDALELYADRLGVIEQRNVLYSPSSFNGPAAARSAKTWRELQAVQAEHDRVYHPDVTGLSKAEQLRHYAFHVAKLGGLLARRATGDDRVGSTRRIADLLLFGIKLSTVMGRKLPDTPLPQSALDDTMPVITRS